MPWDILKHNLGCFELYFFQKIMCKLMLLNLPARFVPLQKDWALVKAGT